ncbi:hypothetical protein C8Q75DRAFT_802736 [Abortiporus biennis]|nr:hypothetical protein C8Q75DRAFT_802736 [Abortiporus biennis]
MNSNTVTFPTASSVSLTQDQNYSAALEIFDVVYGSTPSSWDAIERFYEPSATYENPLVTATSRSVISDINTVAAHLAQVDVPKPVALLFALLRIERTGRWKDPWFRAIRVWSEVGDICESDSFDGHRKVMLEHTLHVLILPGLHSATSQPPPTSGYDRTPTASDLSLSTYSHQHTTLGIDLSFPSPLHLRLPIITKLQFNDAGRISYHRDYWDAKDLLGLIPGMSLTQWITGRLFAQGIHGVVSIGKALFMNHSKETIPVARQDEETGISPAQEHAKSIKSSNNPSRRVSISRRPQ